MTDQRRSRRSWNLRGRMQPGLARVAVVALLCVVLQPSSAFDSGDVCVSFKYRYTCAIRRSDLRVRCWHHHTGEVREGPLNQQYRTISCKGRELCGVLHDGSLAVTTDLWPKATGMPDNTPTKWDAWRSTKVEGSVDYGSLSCDRTTTCYIAGGEYTSVHAAGGQLICWGDRGAAFFEQRFPDKYIAVAVGESVCLEEGSCSEEDYRSRPLPICAIRASDRRIVCCCGSNKFMTTIPTGRFKDVSVADGHGCGVLEEGGIVCWGDGSGGKLLAPNIPSGVGGGGGEAINIMPNGQIQSGALVYADDGPGAEEESVAADVQFVSVSTTTQFSCGLLWNGVTVCWSFLTDTDLAISNPGCMMEAVASDGYVSCGRLLSSGLVPSSEDKERALAAAAERTHQNTTFYGLSDTGVFCWQSFPESFIGLERPTETWSLDERRVPLDIRPPLDTLAVCMGLPQREATFDKTRIEALAIALVLATALAFSAYRMVILKRFGDFSFGVTVADHTVFWFGFISGLFDVVSQACFFFMDILYISFRALFLEANKPYITIVLASAVLLGVSIIFFVYTSWHYSSDEYGKIDLRSPMAIAKRRFLVSGASLLIVDVSQMVIIVVYTATMIEAGLRPSASAMFSALCCCVGPVYMVVKNYFRAKNAPAKPNEAVQQRKGDDLIFGDLAKKGAGAFAGTGSKGQRRAKQANSRFLAHKMFGKKPNGALQSPGSSNRILPAAGAHSFRRHQPPGGAVGLSRGGAANQSQSAIIAAFANKKTQARIKQLASATTKKQLMATQSERRQMD